MNRTARTVHPENDKQNRAIGTGQPEQYRRKRTQRQKNQYTTNRTKQLGPDSQDRTIRTGQPRRQQEQDQSKKA
jgi:hypothetical protein